MPIKKYPKRPAFAIPIAVVLLTLVRYHIKSTLPTGNLCTFFQWFFVVFIVAMSSLCLIGLYKLINKTPIAIISSSGIWIKQFGIIPWSNILAVNPYLCSRFHPSIESVGIQVRDIALLSKQASITGKSIILQSKILKCPTFVIVNMELEAKTVINFAKQFIME